MTDTTSHKHDDEQPEDGSVTNDRADAPPTDTGHSDADEQSRRNVEDESPS